MYTGCPTNTCLFFMTHIWTSGGGWRSSWLQWPEGTLTWSLVWCFRTHYATCQTCRCENKRNKKYLWLTHEAHYYLKALTILTVSAPPPSDRLGPLHSVAVGLRPRHWCSVLFKHATWLVTRHLWSPILIFAPYHLICVMMQSFSVLLIVPQAWLKHYTFIV